MIAVVEAKRIHYIDVPEAVLDTLLADVPTEPFGEVRVNGKLVGLESIVVDGDIVLLLPPGHKSKFVS